MSVFKRIIAVSLAFSIIISMVTVVSAADTSSSTLEIDYLPDMVASWESTFYSWGTSILGDFYEDTYYQACWSAIDKCFAGYLGRCSSLTTLQNRCTVFNNTIKKQWAASTLLYGLASAGKYPVVQVAYVSSLGAYSLVDVNNGLILVNSVGSYTWFKEVTDTESDTYQNRVDIWLPFSTAINKTQVSVLTKDSLSDLCLTLNQTDRTCSVRDTEIRGQAFYVIIDSYNNIYANADGCPYVAHYDKTVTDNKYDYIVQEGDTINEGDTIYNDNSTIIEGATTNYEIVDNSKVIDLTNGVFNYIGEQELSEYYIDEMIWDFSSQSYSADTYNVTYDNDTYNTYNYTWNITYNITNTYITNIGQTELYEPLELYYVLPDGRSSADLTAEEVACISFEFADCVNYAKSATDTYLRALYHFDGNTDDSSYFSTQGKFEWISGASITYMDVGTFDGALYLGPEDHQFQITLPSSIGSGDFTVQFRYYQEGAADTQSNIENSLAIGGTAVLQWDESYLYSQTSTTACAALGIGSWSEIAVIRSSDNIYLYYNGLNIASFTDTTAYTGTITLTLGDTTRASSMIDELRVINFALVEGGASYTCTSVPYDTNAVLVLPDSAFPIADEYWEIKSSYTNIFSQYGLDDWTDFASLSSYFQSIQHVKSLYGDNSSAPGGKQWYSAASGYYNAFPYFMYNSNMLSFESYSAGSVFNKKYVSAYINDHYVMTNSYIYKTLSNSKFQFGNIATVTSFAPTYGIHSIVASSVPNVQALASGTYTLSLVNSSGEVSSHSFYVPKYSELNSCSGHVNYCVDDYSTAFGYDFGLLTLPMYETYDGYYRQVCYLFIMPNQNDPDPIMYMELVAGSTTDLTAEKISCIYSSEEVQPNTAAIQTDIPINGYTVGGVRPTFPVRGDVWMPVSNNRITNVYVYNGSAWEEVNARWYTGSRWIPIYAFDITTLEDCWDIADIDTTLVMIGTESQFWSWLQGAWQKMLDKLDAIIIALGGDPNYSPDSSGSGGTGLWNRIKQTFSDALASIIETLMTFITDVLQLVLDLVYDLLSFFFDFLTSEVITGIANLFSSFTDGSLIVFFQQEITGTDEEGNETTTTVIGLPDGIATAFAFFAGVIMILPDELRNLLIFGVGALILIGILKLAKS